MTKESLLLVDEYLLHLEARNLAPTTTKATSEYIKPFALIHDVRTCGSADLREHLAQLTRRCQPWTVRTAWRHLRGFFQWLGDEEHRPDNPMRHIVKPIVPPTDPDVLTPDEITALMAACEGDQIIDFRDRAIICLFLDTGLRLSELAALTTDDIIEGQQLRVFGKGRKWRVVPLGEWSSLALQQWLNVSGCASGPLWPGKKRGLAAGSIRKIVQRRGRAAGIDLHPHALRHTFVDQWIRNGGTEIDLSHLAGWTSTRLVETYARRYAKERAIEAHRTIAPLDRLVVANRESRRPYSHPPARRAVVRRSSRKRKLDRGGVGIGRASKDSRNDLEF